MKASLSSSALYSLVAINSTQNKFETTPIRSNIPLDLHLPYSLLFIFCHFSVVTFLVRHRSVVPNLTFLLAEFLEFRRDKASNITERCFWVLFFDGRTSVNRIQEVGTHVTLWCVWILLDLLAFLSAAIWISRRNVVLHLILIAHLVAFSFLGPLFHFLLIEFLELAGQNTSLYDGMRKI